jgi:hypothetical protein
VPYRLASTPPLHVRSSAGLPEACHLRGSSAARGSVEVFLTPSSPPVSGGSGSGGGVATLQSHLENWPGLGMTINPANKAAYINPARPRAVSKSPVLTLLQHCPEHGEVPRVRKPAPQLILCSSCLAPAGSTHPPEQPDPCQR